MKRQNHTKFGFTLIETLVVVSTIAIIGSILPFVDIGTFRNVSFGSEIETIGLALQNARFKSQNNLNQSKHGLIINPENFNGYVLFEGDSYELSNKTTNIKMDSFYKINLSATSKNEIIFEQISGNVLDSGDIEIVNPETGKVTSININYEGKISL